MWLKCCTQYVCKLGNLSGGRRTRKYQFSFQFQRKAMPKNLLYNCTHFDASKVLLRILQAGLQQYMNQELPDVQTGFIEGKRNQRSNCQHLLDQSKNKKIPEKHLLLLY